MEVAPGTTSRADLLTGDGPVLEVLDFSAPNVEALSGDFGMEIRVGYENGPDGRRPNWHVPVAQAGAELRHVEALELNLPADAHRIDRVDDLEHRRSAAGKMTDSPDL